MQLEHAYTFKKFRGNKIMPAVMNQLFQIARERGFKRVITYVLKENIASLKGCYNVGFRDFEIVYRTKLPFSTRYEITSPVKELK
jgi:RimJ/RimL family protein N-acetyltransferase